MSATAACADDRAFDSIAVGDSFAVDRTFTAEDVHAFAAVSGDASPLHVDPDYATTTEFGGCVVHGILLASLFSQLVGMRVPGRPALYLGQDLVFRKPVRVGEPVRALARVTAKSEATRTLLLATEIRTLDGALAVSGAGKVKVRGVTTAVGTASAEQTRDAPTPTAPRGRPVALVTGGSRGLGAAIAIELARRGMAVAVNFLRDAARAGETVSAIERDGGTAASYQADVRDHDDVATMIARCVAELGLPRVLVHAAGGALGQRSALELGWGDFCAHLDYQVRAALLLAQAVHPHMKAAGGGSIVNIASQVVTGVPPTQMADYVTAKHALEGLSKALAAEWAADGVRVNVVSPGLTRTDLTVFHPERVFRGEAMRTPLRRIATPEDVARAVAYLAGDDGAFVTGTNLFVTGGQVML
jgi:3-oxoacyl-[acyl-carrier protein] reductase